MPVEHLAKTPHHWHVGHIKLRQDAALYLTHTIRAFALSLVGIFLPVYLYQTSVAAPIFSSNPSINGMSWVLFYFIIKSATVVIVMFSFAPLIYSKIRLKRSIIISFIILCAQVVLWYLSSENIYLLIPAAILGGFKILTYWIPYHVLFVRKTAKDDHHYGQQSAKRIFYVKIFGGIAPLIGGLIISTFGFHVLFTTVFLLLLVSGLPTLFSVSEGSHGEHNVYRAVKRLLFERKARGVNISMIGNSLDAVAYSFFWPVLLFIVLSNFTKVGFLSSFSLVTSAFLYLFVGKYVDGRGTKKIHTIGGIMNGFFQLCRLLITNATAFFGIEIFDRMNTPMYSVPLMSQIYEHAKEFGESDFIIFREFLIHAVIALAGLAVMVAIILTGTWRWVFVLGIIGSLLSITVEYDK